MTHSTHGKRFGTGILRTLAIAIAFASGLVAVTMPASIANAQDAAPTPAQLEKAKKAFGEGKKQFEAGNFPEAVAKFKESYNLSKNPVLLYNIALANESAGMQDIALFYYRKFLTDAPADAPQRAEVTDKVKALEKVFSPGGSPATALESKGDPSKPDAAKPGDAHKVVTIKPAGTYSATDFQHQAIETAPPKTPLDITAFVPEDSGWSVTLFYRTAGEGKFTSKVMKWRYKELVGRVPAPKMIGNAVQYYIEVKDQTGNVITRSGKSTSPNLVNLEAGASPRFYPDISDDGETHQTEADIKHHDDEDPLNRNKKVTPVHSDAPVSVQPAGTIVPSGPGDGFSDVGSTKFTYAKFGTTATAGLFIGLGITFGVLAGKQASALKDDSTMCGSPPCRGFDQYDADLESAGKTDATVAKVMITFGVLTAAVAGYFWYRELTAKKHGELKASARTPSSESSWVVAPTLGDASSGSYVGAAAATRF